MDGERITVSDLNDMSKIEVGRLRIDFKSIALKDVIDSVIRSTRKQIEEKQQTLNLNIPADLAPVCADRSRVEQVMVNLISNAHKYTPAGGAIVVAAEPSPNHWDTNGAANVIHIWVKDNGIGISEEDQKKMFKMFQKLSARPTGGESSNGLGLSIIKTLTEKLKGSIEVKSKLGEGTQFTISFPSHL